MFAKRLFILVMLAAAVAASSSVAPAHAAKAKQVRLKAFSSCSSLIGYGNRFAAREAVPVWRTSTPPPQTDSGAGSTGSGPQPQPASGSPESAPAAPTSAQRGGDFSGTNTQEADVDEPDVVKTDGSFVYAVAGRSLHAIDVRGGATTLVGSLKLPDGAWGAELLVFGKRALVMWNAGSHYYGDMPMARPASSSPAYYGGDRAETVMAEVDLTDPAAMRLVRTVTVDGRLISSRLNGATARVITAATPRALEVPIDTSMPPQQQRAALRSEAGSKRANRWLPRRVTRWDGGQGMPRAKAAVACRSVRHPQVFSGLDMVTVLTIDLAKGITPVDSDGLMTDAETVYASDKALYVATRRWLRAVDAPMPLPTSAEPPAIRTQIHRFDISDPHSTTYAGSGDVSGYLLNQFSLSEHAGVLRTATTDGPMWWPGQTGPLSESAVTTLKLNDAGLLGTVGRVGGLGKGERIYAVRFIGDTGYVVTFRQTDPLYTVDVSDPANPTRLHQRSLGKNASSDAEYDHHAFLYWPATNLLMLPVQHWSETQSESFVGAIGMTVKRDTGIEEIARVEHDGGEYPVPVRRSMVIGDRVYTLSELGFKASRLDTLADAGWVRFPGS